MEKFAADLYEMAGDVDTRANNYMAYPVVDSTGLKGAYDFDLNWTGRQWLVRAGTDGISIFDAVDKQLGLKLALGHRAPARAGYRQRERVAHAQRVRSRQAPASAPAAPV